MKLTYNLLLPFCAVLLLAGAAGAADQPGQDDHNPATGGQSADPSLTPKDRDYLAATKRCEALKEDQRPKCIQAAKKKFGQM